MRILFFGNKDRSIKCLEALIEKGHTIVAVVTQKDQPHQFWTGSLAKKAKELNLPVCFAEDIPTKELADSFQDKNVELIILCGYNQILKKEILNLPSRGAINLHAGKLPDYRGGSPMNWTIINGEVKGCATIHYALEKVDAGPILAEEEFPITLEDTILDVENKTLAIFPRLLNDAVDQIERGVIKPRPQNLNLGTYYCPRKPLDGRVNWQMMTAKNVYDFVRALTHPFPGAFCFYEGQKIFIWKAKLLPETIKHTPGRVCMRGGKGVVVMAQDRALLIERVQQENEKESAASEILETGRYLT